MVDLPVLMHTKLYRPPTPADFVFRVGLEDALKQVLSKPLTLISAPAGYGKTTLVSAWLEELDCPRAWLSLDENDDQLGGFLAYFLAAIQSISPGAVLGSQALLEAPNLPPVYAIAGSLSNDLVQLTRPFLLVLDDYSVIHDSSIHQLVSELLKHPPQSMHIVMTCRHDPPLPVSNLRARHQMTEVRRQGLRFSRAEIETFMQKVIGVPLDDRAITILEEKTEGWAAGLRLAALSLIHSEDLEQRFDNMEGEDRYVLEYLADEVISRLPQEIQEFLLTTSILERMCGPLCDRVIGLDELPGKSQAYLEWLESANLFTMPLDGQQTWYRYHPLFQELLKLLLTKGHTPEEIARLHARASAWFSEQDFVEEAICHALASGDENAVIHLVETHRCEAMNRECWQQIERWLRLLPRWVIDQRPELLVLEAWTLNRSGLNAEISTSLDQVEALTENITLPEAEYRRLRGEIDALRSCQLYGQGDVQGALTAAHCALEGTGFELSSVRGTAWMVMAMALHKKGDLNGAFETLYDGLKEDRYHLNTFPTRLLIALASIQWMEANPKNLGLTAEYLLKLADERDLPESMSWAHYFLGAASYLRNDLETAEKHFSISARQLSTAPSFACFQSIFGLAATALAQGSAERAREVVESALPIALERNNHGIVAEVEAFQARLDLAQGNIAGAQYWSRQCEGRFLPSPFPAFHTLPFTLARVLIDQGTPQCLSEASRLLDGMQVSAEAAHNTLRLINTLALQALLRDTRGEEAEALSILNRSILLAQPGGVLRPYIDLGPRMASLLSRLLRQGPPSVYLKAILHAFPTQKPAPAPNGAKNLIEPLTDRELEILALLAQRLSNKEIARELVISPMTVKRHTINIYQKLNTNSRREAVDVATALGLFSMQVLPQAMPQALTV